MKYRKFETDTRFLSDTANHRLEIIRDDGLYRHLRMQQPGTSCYYYDVITWPGYLTVTGDMGTWTFSRIADMFKFFGAWEGGINTGYWSEKLEAGSGHSACNLLAQEYDHDAFCKSLKESLSDYLEDSDGDESEDDDWDDDDDTPDSDKAVVREIVRKWRCWRAIAPVAGPDAIPMIWPSMSPYSSDKMMPGSRLALNQSANASVVSAVISCR